MLNKEQIADLQLIFVTRQEISAMVEDVNKKLSNDKQELTAISTKLNFVLWILGIVGSGIIGFIIKYLFGM